MWGRYTLNKRIEMQVKDLLSKEMIYESIDKCWWILEGQWDNEEQWDNSQYIYLVWLLSAVWNASYGAASGLPLAVQLIRLLMGECCFAHHPTLQDCAAISALWKYMRNYLP